MTIMTCEVVAVPAQTLAELPKELHSPALTQLAVDGYVLTRQSGKQVLYKLQQPAFDGVLRAASEVPAALPKQRAREQQARKRASTQLACPLTPEQGRAIRYGLVRWRRKQKLTIMAAARKLGVSCANTYANWEKRVSKNASVNLVNALRRAGLVNLIPNNRKGAN